MKEENTPVLVGCAQITQSEPDPAAAAAPIELIADAARQAASDSGAAAALIKALDTVVVIRSFSDTSWRFACPFGRYSNPPASVANRIGASASRLIYTQPGGNMPQQCVNDLSALIARGEVEAAVITGGESLATQKAAQRSGLTLDWSEDPGGTPEAWGIDRRGWSDLEDRHQMRGAIFAYPLFENAIRGHRQRDLDTHQQAMGQLMEGFARVAADNPLADRRGGFNADTIATVSAENPYIGFPYTKLMNANAFIDQSAAVILTSVGKARELGIDRDRWVFLHGYADGHDHWNITDRRDFHSSPAMGAVFDAAFTMAGSSIDEMDAIDLYSCFPSAVQVACEALNLDESDSRGLTVTGGLPYFGGPGNNYVTHSIAQIMQRVRAKPSTFGLVTANGNYLTKHSAGIYSTDMPAQGFQTTDRARLQAQLDQIPHPPICELASGRARVETWTVMNDRQGPSFAIVIGRLDDGARFIANTATDPDLLASMQTTDFLNHPGKVTNDGQINTFAPD